VVSTQSTWGEQELFQQWTSSLPQIGNPLDIFELILLLQGKKVMSIFNSNTELNNCLVEHWIIHIHILVLWWFEDKNVC